MPAGWSRNEVEATVASYLAMLQAELAGTAYNKAEHRRNLLPLLHNRSEQSVEFKYANISAVLIEIGFPFISGYKPRSNYQKLLLEVVLSQLQTRPEIQKLAANDVVQQATVPRVDDILHSFTDPPRPVELKNRVASSIAHYSAIPINYLEREARNNALGLAGEQFVINFETARLIHAGRENLASRIIHVSQVRGDSSGFDILSFEQSGAERLIEVKTTKYGAHTPFFVSRNELEVSKAKSKSFCLYRVYEFRYRPLIFILRGALSTTCSLDPSSYVARVA